ncbi:MAG: hypothetical protein IJD92_03645 [Bacilli bacterium]|nr:hypothetical protein [Bacilli bacterium]
MNKRQKIIVSIVGIFIVLLALVGLTYGYFLTRIIGNTNDTSVSIKTALLELTYDDEDNIIDLQNLMPGGTIPPKTFSVTNTGQGEVEYGVYLENIVNELSLQEDLTISITCVSETLDTDVTPTPKECKGLDSTQYPEETTQLLTNAIEPSVKHNYTLTVNYRDHGNQSVDMGKTIEGKVQIYAVNDVMDVVVDGTNLEDTDVLELHSEVKTARKINGKYTFKGVMPDDHTLKVVRDGEVIATKEITIARGETETSNTSGSEITVTEETLKIAINIAGVSNGTINIETPTFQNATSMLAYKIKDSAEKGTNGTKFVETAPSTIGSTPSTNWEGGIETLKPYDETSWKELINSSDIFIYYISKEAYDNGDLNGVDLYNGCYYGEGCPESVKQYNPSSNTCEDLEDSYFYVNKYDLSSSNYFYDGKSLNKAYYVSGCINGVPSDGTKEKKEVVLSKTTDDDGTTYFYRGNVKDNYVSFANKCWRIMRINGNGSIKLILEDDSQTCSPSMDSNSLTIQASLSAVSSESEIPTLSAGGFSDYQKNELNNYISYLEPGKWCVENISSSTTPSNLNCNGRVITNYDDDNKMYVGTLTLKEAYYAGGTNENLKGSYFSHYVIDGSEFGMNLGMLSYNGFQMGADEYYPNVYFYNYNIWTDYSTIYNPRPVINLKKDTFVTRGTGTITDPYVVG